MQTTLTFPKLVESLKASDQDHEFYPTTDQIIRSMLSDIESVKDFSRYARFDMHSVLDIGAGDGRVLMEFKRAGFHTLHGIERSPILCEQMPPEILIVGTDFRQQSLLSKKVDVIFCNPPYSEFEEWTEKIVRQAASRVVYLVIPTRWAELTVIADALKFRGVEAKVVRQFDFLDGQRRARAVVDLLRIQFDRENDPFEREFDQQFSELIGKFKNQPKSSIGELPSGPDLPDRMVEMYDHEMANIQRNYHVANQLDAALLKEFDVDPKKIMECLRSRLSGLKNEYWSELFGRLQAVTNRLTSKSRKSLLETLQKHVEVDFTVSNILEVVLWVIKNANRYIDQQVIETYEVMVEKANVKLYKSNQRVWVDDRWRYDESAPKNSHYALEYRIVTHRLGGMRTHSWEHGVTESTADFIGDLMTIARNMGFVCQTDEPRLQRDGRDKWISGGKQEFKYQTEEGERTLIEARAFQNGNVHFRFDQKFMLALNVEHGRLRGWLKTPVEAVHELDDPEAAQLFNTNKRISANAQLLLT